MSLSKSLTSQSLVENAYGIRRKVKNSFIVFEIDEPEVDTEWDDVPVRCESYLSSCSVTSTRPSRRAKTAPSTMYQNSTDEDAHESHHGENSPGSGTPPSAYSSGREDSLSTLVSEPPKVALEAQLREVPQVSHDGDQDGHFVNCRGGNGTGNAASTLGIAPRRLGQWGYHFNENKHVKRTTLMMRNLPNDYSRDMLLMLMDAKGFRGRYNFIYLPMDFRRRAGLGYAFVNMVTVQDAKALRESLHGFSAWEVASQKVLEVHFGDLLQGLRPHVERYRNSPVMHASVPESCRPAIFKDGKKVPFPPPTKRIRAPKGVESPSNAQ